MSEEVKDVIDFLEEKPEKLKKMKPSTVKIDSGNAIIGVIKSSLPFQEEIIYNGEISFIPPYGKIKNVNKQNIFFPLPKGVVFIPDTDK